jgi:uroporphyrin-III C-methyltransferase
VTHREFARGVTFVTGHTKDGTQPNWQALARSGTTLVIYMGLKGLDGILSSLRAAGMDAATPACIIENGTLHGQKQRVATVGSLSGDGFAGPALIVIGDVVRFARAAAADLKAKAA